MKWRIPAALLTVCLLALLFSIGLLGQATDSFSWMIGFSAVLLAGFGVVFSVVWMLVALAQGSLSTSGAPTPPADVVSHIAPPGKSVMEQSEFSRLWQQTRHNVTYDESAKENRERGFQAPQRLILRKDDPPKLGVTNERWPGFRSIDQNKKK